MSVYSSAEEAIESAKDHIDDAIKELSKVVVEQTFGTDEFKDSYKSKVKDTFLKLISIRDDLK